MKKVLVACEYSQVVTLAFRRLGVEAYSCDIIDCEGGHPEWHIKTDVRQLIDDNWDLVVAHPPCTYLCRASAFHIHKDETRPGKMEQAAHFFRMFVDLGESGKRVCIENPYPLQAAHLPKWNQVVCPSQFGHPFTKHTCLWLYNLPPIIPMQGYYISTKSWVRNCSHTGKRRARFWEGIAEAMAAQWSPLL